MADFDVRGWAAALAGRIVAGTVIVFDEFLNDPPWQQHGVRAWNEFGAAWQGTGFCDSRGEAG